jgi:CheY-like chemotaxis protein/anti-sigma regulatory factor (Ser/Thr protein kinase)
MTIDEANVMQSGLAPSPATRGNVRLAKPDGEESPILVVDDSAISRRLVAQLVKRGTGRTVVHAEDGTEALDLLESLEPAVVLADLQLPGIDGLELVELIRERHPGIPVILMTSQGSELLVMDALRAGAASYVPKRGLAKLLVRTLHQVISVSQDRQTRRRLPMGQTQRGMKFVIPNDQGRIAPLISFLTEDLVAFGIGDVTTQMRVAVALQEALSNAMFHGNLEVSSDLRQEDEREFYRMADLRRQQSPYANRQIHVSAVFDHSHVEVKIRDEGPGFDVKSLEKPFDPEDLMRVGGRGLLLIRTFMDEVTHNESGNEIRMVKRN